METNVNENIDSTNDEVLEDNLSDNEFGEHQSESGEEPQEQMGSDLQGDDDGDSEGDSQRQARKDRADAQIARLKEENRKLKEAKRKAERESKVGSSGTDMMAKAFLAATHDIKEPDAQEEALRLADKFDMSVDEFMEDPDYRQKITGMQKRIVQNRKVAANTGGAAQRKKDAGYVADYFKKNNDFPQGTSLELKNEAIDLMSRK